MQGKFINGDCMHPEYGLPSYPDKFFDLAVVDPPYGIGAGKGMNITKPSRPNSYKTPPKHKPKEWDDNRPPKVYWDELFRVSKNQIVWGGNYFTDCLPVGTCWFFWDKINGVGSHFADGEFAWTSFKTSSKKITCSVFAGTRGGKDRIHPTQKPVKLYQWLLENYAKEGDLILDTHVGSASSLIACESMGFNYVGFELDSDYYEAAKKRLKTVQKRLF